VTIQRIPVGAQSVVWIGPGLLDEAAKYLESPSGRFFLFSCANAGAAADAVRRALAGRLLACDGGSRELGCGTRGGFLQRRWLACCSFILHGAGVGLRRRGNLELRSAAALMRFVPHALICPKPPSALRALEDETHQ
jgi:hypothetical protein